MTTGRHWMPWYIGDYLADTMHLTTLEHGAYCMLIMHYWRTGPLPNDDRMLADITKMRSDHWGRIGDRIKAFFSLGDDGRLHQKRADKEIERITLIGAKRSQSAKAKHRKYNNSTDANAVTKSDSAVVVVVPLESTEGKMKGEIARAPAKPARRSATGTRIPEGWRPGPSEIALATSLELDPNAIAAEFVDYWLGVPGAKGLKLDWPATFRNRCRDIAQRRGGPGLPLLRTIQGGRPAPPSRDELLEREVMELIDREAAD